MTFSDSVQHHDNIYMKPDWSIWTFCYAEGRLPIDFVRGTPVASNQIGRASCRERVWR